MALFGNHKTPPPDDVLDARAGPEALLQNLDRVARAYLEKADRGDIVYPACKREPGTAGGGAREIWRDTRLEALRYLTMIPGRDDSLLIAPARQAEMIESFLRLKPHDETVIDFTGQAGDDVAIAIIAGLNWLNHCAGIAKVDRAKITGILRNFRKVVVVAQRWWSTDGAEARCAEMLAARQQLPPLMLYLVWLEHTHLAKEVAAAAALPSEVVRTTDAWTRFEAARDPEDLS
ncbi:hypothetical protein JQ596_33145 [Bradyrhizobium manausense]|uniref:hypothetical protein n=1 Tax=Bradyrhizobium manausense TaxID=989370 RepID=UPI001BA689B5|nr:hypothetical protein [Bradyrhizobium manausense]MBR0830365.1 hypothetical protein [Bradyrhizobium manausense]